MNTTRIFQALVDYNYYKNNELDIIYSLRYSHTNNNSIYNILLSDYCGYKTKKYFYEDGKTKTFFFGIQSKIRDYNKSTALNIKENSGFCSFEDWIYDFKATYNYNNPKYIAELNVIKCVAEFNKFNEDKDCNICIYYKNDLLFKNVELKTYNYYWKTVRFIKDNINSFINNNCKEINR